MDEEQKKKTQKNWRKNEKNVSIPIYFFMVIKIKIETKTKLHI